MDVTAANAAEAARVLRAFLEPFADAEVKVKPAIVKDNRALALHYIDARLVMDRLDTVVGLGGWQDVYTVLPTGEVECRLSVRIGTEWITKADVGSQSEQPDEGDRMKAAYSDALKRAAVKFGIGRFLYRLPQVWRDWDPVKKQFAPAATTAPAPEDSARLRARYESEAAAAPDRDRLVGLWRSCESDLKAGRIGKADADAAFATFRSRAGRLHPRQQPSGGGA